MSQNNGSKPDKVFRIGFVSAAIWMQDGEGGRQYPNVRFKKTYRDDDEKLQDTTSFGHADLLNVAELAKRAEDWVATQ